MTSYTTIWEDFFSRADPSVSCLFIGWVSLQTFCKYTLAFLQQLCNNLICGYILFCNSFMTAKLWLHIFACLIIQHLFCFYLEKYEGLILVFFLTVSMSVFEQFHNLSSLNSVTLKFNKGLQLENIVTKPVKSFCRELLRRLAADSWSSLDMLLLQRKQQLRRYTTVNRAMLVMCACDTAEWTNGHRKRSKLPIA